MIRSKKNNYAFVDASNLFYGGVKSLGWKIDYEKLIKYVKKEYSVKKVYYYGGIEMAGLAHPEPLLGSVDLSKLLRHVNKRVRTERLSQIKLMDLVNLRGKIKFYSKLEQFGYILRLKPVKTFWSSGHAEKKANCDVDMTLDMMRFKSEYKKLLILSGDGDFASVLKYLVDIGKSVWVLARGERCAKEIKQLVGGDFRDFVTLRSKLEYIEK